MRSEPSFFQPDRLALRKHPQRAADFHTQRGDPAHHLQYIFEFPALRCLAPCRPHAETRNAAFGSFAGHADDVLRVQQPLPPDARVIVRALRAIRAVLRAPPRLYGNELASLHAVGLVKLTMQALRPEDQFWQRRAINCRDLGALPIMAQHTAAGRAWRRRRHSLGTHGPPGGPVRPNATTDRT